MSFRSERRYGYEALTTIGTIFLPHDLVGDLPFDESRGDFAIEAYEAVRKLIDVEFVDDVYEITRVEGLPN